MKKFVSTEGAMAGWLLPSIRHCSSCNEYGTFRV